MQELVYFKNYCPRCGGGIEFPAHGVGMTVGCPHCDQMVPLAFPKHQLLDPGEQLDAYLELKSFPKTRAQVAFLKAIAMPGAPGEAKELEAWTAVLGEPPGALVGRLIKAGLLAETKGDMAGVLKKKGRDDLKELARARKLSLKGTKEEMLYRLFLADPAGMTAVFQGNPFIEVTAAGRAVVEKYVETENDLKAKAETSALAALRAGKYEEACKAVAGLEAAKVFQRGPGIDWKHYDAARDLRILREIAEAKPKALEGIPARVLPSLRVSACMMGLWGDNNPKRWLTDEERPFAFGAFLMLHAAIASTRLKEMKRSGIKKVKVVCTGGEKPCPVCAADDKKTYPVEAAPELPHYGCKCEYGCGCLLQEG